MLLMEFSAPVFLLLSRDLPMHPPGGPFRAIDFPPARTCAITQNGIEQDKPQQYGSENRQQCPEAAHQNPPFLVCLEPFQFKLNQNGSRDSLFFVISESPR